MPQHGEEMVIRLCIEVIRGKFLQALNINHHSSVTINVLPGGNAAWNSSSLGAQILSLSLSNPLHYMVFSHFFLLKSQKKLTSNQA